MIGLDTNILVRLLIEDDPEQTPIAQRLVRDALAEGESCYVSDLALCELEWVLVSCYQATRADLALAYQRLLDLTGFVFDGPETVRLALERFRASKVEFSDLLLGGRGRERGARTTYTFERTLSRQSEFTRLV